MSDVNIYKTLENCLFFNNSFSFLWKNHSIGYLYSIQSPLYNIILSTIIAKHKGYLLFYTNYLHLICRNRKSPLEAELGGKEEQGKCMVIVEKLVSSPQMQPFVVHTVSAS